VCLHTNFLFFQIMAPHHSGSTPCAGGGGGIGGGSALYGEDRGANKQF
jgi:hypothetical protein